jgi:hypothetical protein
MARAPTFDSFNLGYRTNRTLRERNATVKKRGRDFAVALRSRRGYL